jgi:hypothetical protein
MLLVRWFLLHTLPMVAKHRTSWNTTPELAVVPLCPARNPQIKLRVSYWLPVFFDPFISWAAGVVNFHRTFFPLKLVSFLLSFPESMALLATGRYD